MQKPDVDLTPTDDPKVVELRVRLDLGRAPFSSEEAEIAAELERTCLELVAARSEVETLRVEVGALRAARVDAAGQAEAAFRQSFDAATVVTPPPAEMRILSAPPRAAARLQLPTPAMAVALGGRPRVSRARPQVSAVIARSFTDTLSDLEVDFGLGHAIGRTVGGAVDRVLGFFGIWRADEWDDRDELRDTSSFAPIVPWYRRSTVLLVLIAIAIATFFAVGGLEWARGKMPRAAAVSPPHVSAATVAPAALPEHTNLLAGTPLDPNLRARPNRR